MSEKSPSKLEELPATLGLGTLDPASVSVNRGKTTADYLLGSQVVYQVTLTLVNVAAAADWWWQSGSVPPEQEYRLTVLHASKALPGELRLYQGEPGRSAPVFCVFATDDVEANLKETSRLFHESAQQALASL